MCGHLFPAVCRQGMNLEAQPLTASQEGRKRSSNPSAEVHYGDSHIPPSNMFMADTAVNRHITDSGDMASGENGAGSHSEAQDGTDGGEATPA